MTEAFIKEEVMRPAQQPEVLEPTNGYKVEADIPAE
jgi:hypothetical protein